MLLDDFWMQDALMQMPCSGVMSSSWMDGYSPLAFAFRPNADRSKARQLLLMTFRCSEGVWIKPHPRELTVLWLLDVNRGRNWVPGVSPA
jgi:hypothetical protein